MHTTKTMPAEIPDYVDDDDAQKLADSLATALNADKIPCVLWGNFLLASHGVPTVHSVSPPYQPHEKITLTRQKSRLTWWSRTQAWRPRGESS